MKTAANAASVGDDAAAQPRWLRVGTSSDREASRAGEQAASAACRDGAPKLLIVFCSDSYDLEELLSSIRRISRDVPLIGCSTSGEIATSGPDHSSVVVIALGGPGFSVSTRAATAVSNRLREAGEEVASCMRQVEERPYRVMLLLSDGLAGDQQEIVKGAYGVLGAAIPLVGGCAGDDLKMQRTFQLCGDQVLQESVVGAALASDSPLGIGVRHGWRPVGEPMLVTKSADNRVYRLNDRPALDLYLDRLQAPQDVRSDGAAFTRFALTHPLGLRRRTGESQVRFVAEANFDDRSLGCIAEVPQGGMAWIMEGDADSVLRATDAACTDAIAALEGRPPIGMLAFDCIARKGVLGEEGIKDEIDRIAEHAGSSSVAGFYTYGEIARTKGITGFHNQTLVVLALS